MDDSYFEQTYTGVDYATNRLPGERYEACTFRQCILREADLRDLRLEDCRFEHCDLSNARTENLSLQGVTFIDCKLLGVDFAACTSFNFHVEWVRCRMSDARFSGQGLGRSGFSDCELRRADFTGADLRNVSFGESDLTDAIFEATDLRGTDLRLATGYTIDPLRNRVRGTRVAWPGAVGLLRNFGLRIEP